MDRDGELQYLIGKFEMFESKVEEKINALADKVDRNSDKVDKIGERIDVVEAKFGVWATVVKTLKMVGVMLFFLISLNFDAIAKLISKGI